jgi:hypothetical protein
MPRLATFAISQWSPRTQPLKRARRARNRRFARQRSLRCPHQRARAAQILPGLGLVRQGAQQVGRMVGHHHRNRRSACPAAQDTRRSCRAGWPASRRRRAAHAPPRGPGEQSVAAGSAQSVAADRARRSRSRRLRGSIVGRTTLHGIGDVDISPRCRSIAASIASSSLPAGPTKGSPRASSSAPGPSPMNSQSAADIADAEHRLPPLLAKRAGPTGGNAVLQLLPGHAGDLLRPR